MNIALLSAIISFLSLDTTIAFQMLISSPLFSCPILGLILGDARLGFEMGFLLQLLWIGRIPAGASIVPEGNIASMIVTTLVILNRHNAFPNSTLMLVFLEGILISYLGAVITIFYRKLNGKIFDVAIKQIESARFKFIICLEAISVILYFVLMFAFTYLAILSSQIILPEWITIIGEIFEEQLIIVKPTILGLGLAMTLPLLWETLTKAARR